jgi:hypothetical protein
MLENEEGLGHFLGGDKHGSAYQVPRGVNLSCSLLLLEAGRQHRNVHPRKEKRKKNPILFF